MISEYFVIILIGFGVGRGQAPLSAMKQVCVCSLYILHYILSCAYIAVVPWGRGGEGILWFWGKVLEPFTRPFLPPAILLRHSCIYHWSISHINNTLFSTITLWFLSPDAKLNCLKTSPYTVIFNNYSSSPNGLWVNSPRGWRPNGQLTQRPWGREE